MASVAATRPARGAAVAALKHRNFAIFWTGALVSNIGTWIQTVTVPYVLYKTTDSAAWVGLAGFCQFIPGVIMGPWSGAIADRFNRRRVLMTTQTALAFCALGLWVMWQAGVRSPGALVAVVLRDRGDLGAEHPDVASVRHRARAQGGPPQRGHAQLGPVQRRSGDRSRAGRPRARDARAVVGVSPERDLLHRGDLRRVDGSGARACELFVPASTC